MKSFKFNNKEFFVHLNDLPDGLELGDLVAIDTETTGLSLVRDRLCVMQICSDSNSCHLIKFDPEYFNQVNKPKNILKILNNEKIEKIFHFGRFDIGMIKKHLEIDCKKVFCTKIASRLVRTYTDRHGLKELCKDLLNIEISKSQQTTDWSSPNLSENQVKYAGSDVIYLHQLRNKLIGMLKREKRFDLAKDIFKFLNVRTDLDLMGWDKEDIFSHSI